MTVDCAVIRDLLPLYREGLLSPESVKLVEEHLPNCPDCQQELEELRQGLPGETDTAAPLKTLSRGLRLRRWLSLALAVLLLLALFASFTAWLTGWKELPWQEGELTFHKEGDQLVISILRPNVTLSITSSQDPDSPGRTIYWATLTERRLDSFEGRPGTPPYMVWSNGDKGTTGPGFVPHQFVWELEPGENPSIYYSKTGELAIPVYGAIPSPESGMMALPRLALIYYLGLAACLALFFGLLLFLFRKKPRPRAVFSALLGLPLAYTAGHLLIKGFETTSYESMARDFLWILVCAAFLYAAWLVFLRLRKIQKA